MTAPYVVAMARATGCGTCFDVAMRPYGVGLCWDGKASEKEGYCTYYIRPTGLTNTRSITGLTASPVVGLTACPITAITVGRKRRKG